MIVADPCLSGVSVRVGLVPFSCSKWVPFLQRTVFDMKTCGSKNSVSTCEKFAAQVTLKVKKGAIVSVGVTESHRVKCARSSKRPLGGGRSEGIWVNNEEIQGNKTPLGQQMSGGCNAGVGKKTS